MIPPQPDDVPDINILIWRLYSKAIIQSAFCTYVSEIYFYTFLEDYVIVKHEAINVPCVICKQEQVRI